MFDWMGLVAEPGIRWDGTISMGSVVAAGTIIVTIIATASAALKRITDRKSVV